MRNVLLCLLCALACANPFAPPPTHGADPPGSGDPAEPEASSGLVLRPVSETVALGEVAVLEIVNTSADTFRFHHPGGSNGCESFHWSVRLIAADGTIYSDGWDRSDRNCTAAMVPPRDIVIAPGEAEPVWIDTRRELFLDGGGVGCGRWISLTFPLKPSHYTVEVTGAEQRLSTTLVVEE